MENARIEIWERPDKDGQKGRWSASVGQLLGKPKWEKPLADWIMAMRTIPLKSRYLEDRKKVGVSGGFTLDFT
jgi:hypothetical protein